MRLKTLRLKNFLSHKDSFLDFDSLDKVALIVGSVDDDPDASNGAGKTSILEGILYSLYERSRISDNKNATLNELVRRGSDGQMEVELCFEQDGHIYKITRTRDAKKNKGTCDFAVQTKGGWKSQKEAKKGTTNKAIISQIGLDYGTFISSVCFQQEEVDRFVKATGAERKEIIKNILQLDRYADYKLTAKAKLEVIKDELKVVEMFLTNHFIEPLELKTKEKDLEDADRKVKLFTLERDAVYRQLEKLRKEQISHNERAQRREVLQGRLKEKQEMHKKLLLGQSDALSRQEEYAKVLEEKRQEFQELQKEYQKVENTFTVTKAEIMSSGKVATKKLQDAEKALEAAQETSFSIKGELARIDKKKEEVHSHKDGSRCPTCYTLVTDDAKQNSQKALEEEAAILDSRQKTAQVKLDNAKALQRKHLAEVDDLKEKVNEYNQWVKEKNYLKTRLADLKDAGTNAKSIVDDQKSIMKEHKSLIDQYKKEIDLAEEEYSKIEVDTKAFEGLNKEIVSKNKQYDESNSLLSQTLLTKGKLEAEIQAGYMAIDKAKEYSKKRDELVKEKFYYTQLVELFGKEIPSLIIENSCAEIESIANDILSGLSDMSIRFITQQATLKGEYREAFEIQVERQSMKEPLFIDSLSNGQRFRVVLAIRIALSRLLASRRSASPVEFLFYDECFAPLDNRGIEEIIEIFKYLQKDFRHQLIITHRTDLKERFGDNVIIIKQNNDVSRIVA